LNFYPEIGGAPTHIADLSKHMRPFINNQFLITREYEDKRYDDREYGMSHGLQIYREDLPKWLPQGRLQILVFIPRAIRTIISLNRKYGIDIIEAHCAWTGIAAYVAGKILKKPVIWMAHGNDDIYGKVQGITETLFTKTFKPYHAIVLDDGTNAPSKYQNILGDEKVTVVYHAIDTAEFNPEYKNTKLRKKLGLEQSFIVISISLLIYHKRIDLALLGFRKFLESTKSEDSIFLIIGDGPLRSFLEKKGLDYGIKDKVIFLGSIPHSEIRDYLAMSDVLIATSIYSNVNRTVQEAMSAGKPVLIFNSGNVQEIFSHENDCLMAENGDVNDLAAKLSLLYKDERLRKYLGDNARDVILENRSWGSRIKTELNVIKKVIEKSIEAR
jgi:glycosyltransferase involved in cell wall biosynthesis